MHFMAGLGCFVMVMASFFTASLFLSESEHYLVIHSENLKTQTEKQYSIPLSKIAVALAALLFVAGVILFSIGIKQ